MIVMLLTEPPSVEVSSSIMAALLDENIHIKCSAEGGNPDLHNITLLKNNAPLTVSTQTDSLTYDTKGVFGVYTCLVESLYTTATESLLLQEKGKAISDTSCCYSCTTPYCFYTIANFQLFLNTNTHGKCTLFLVSHFA